MAAETGIERERIRLYHKHALKIQMSHFAILSSSIINVVSSSEIKNVMRYIFVFEVYIPVAVSS